MNPFKILLLASVLFAFTPSPAPRSLHSSHSPSERPCVRTSDDCTVHAPTPQRDRCIVRVGTRACGAEFNTCTGVARMWCY